MALVHVMQPQGPSGCSQGPRTYNKQLSCPHQPGPRAQPRHPDTDYSQARRSHPCRWLCSAFFSSEPLAPFPPAQNPLCPPGSQGLLATAKQWGTVGTSSTKRAHLPHAGAWPGSSSTGPAREGAQGSAGGEVLGWPPASTTAMRGAVPGDMQSLEQDTAPGGLS